MTAGAARLEPHDRRSELVRAAYRVMARDGVHRVPLDQVARAAGVSKGLVLYHFETKDNLVLAALEWVLGATAERIRRAVRAADPGAAVSAVIDAVWVGPEANRDFFRFYLDGVEHQTRSDGFSELGETGRTIINGLYQEVLEDAGAAGVLSVADTPMAAETMRALIEGTFLQWLQTTDWRRSHAEYRERCRAAVLSMLGVDRGVAPFAG